MNVQNAHLCCSECVEGLDRMIMELLIFVKQGQLMENAHIYARANTRVLRVEKAGGANGTDACACPLAP